MKCTFCGEEVPVGAKFCPNCGTEVKISEQSIDDTGCDNEASEKINNSSAEYDYSYGHTDDGGQKYESSQTSSDSFYEYGQSRWNQGEENRQSDANQGYNYGPANGNASMNNQQMNGFGGHWETSGKNINGTPYLVFSILTTLCCCVPLGIAAIVFSSRINTLQNQGDYAGAQAAAKKAKILCIVGAIGGLIASIGIGAIGTLETFQDSGYEEIYDEIVDDDEEYEDDSVVNKSYEGVEGAWNEFSVMIEGHTLTFPCSADDIAAIGLELDDEEDVVNKVVSAGEYELVFYENDADDYLMFMMCNDTDGDVKVLDCKVKGVYLAYYNIENGLSVVFPGGVQIGTDINDVIENWGEPDDKYEGDGADTYNWYDEEYNYCTVSVNHETGKVESIDLDGSGL